MLDREVPVGQHVLSRLLKHRRRLRKAGAQPIGDFLEVSDRDALVDVILRVSALVEVVPELRELDLNPVKVLAPGKGAVIVDSRLRVGPVG